MKIHVELEANIISPTTFFISHPGYVDDYSVVAYIFINLFCYFLILHNINKLYSLKHDNGDTQLFQVDFHKQNCFSPFFRTVSVYWKFDYGNGSYRIFDLIYIYKWSFCQVNNAVNSTDTNNRYSKGEIISSNCFITILNN